MTKKAKMGKPTKRKTSFQRQAVALIELIDQMPKSKLKSKLNRQIDQAAKDFIDMIEKEFAG